MENQKKVRLFWIFIISGILVLGGGMYSVYYRINSIAPLLFSYDTDLTDTNPLEQRKKDFAELSIKDSDGDGLSDFAELYIHKTSPYIKDSDSDGINDKLEIDQTTNPLCPSGQDCTGIITTNSNSTVANVNAVVNSNTSTTTTSSGPDADQIREELSKVGMSEADLNQISDDDLVKLYNDTINQQPATTTGNANSGATDQLSNLQNLNSSEIRDLLQQNGISEEQLQNISDDDLQEMYHTTLQEQLNQTNTQEQ